MDKIKIMEAYLVLFHEATRDAFAWLSNVPGGQFGLAPDHYLQKYFGYIPYNTYESLIEKCFIEQLDEKDLDNEMRKEVYSLFCKFFKQKALSNE